MAGGSHVSSQLDGTDNEPTNNDFEVHSFEIQEHVRLSVKVKINDITFSCDFIGQRYMNVNKVAMAQYFAKELDEVLFSLGMKRHGIPEVPSDLLSHPEWGQIILDLVRPIKALRKMVMNKK